MSVEIIGIDHIYIAVSDLERSEHFYDRFMEGLGFRKGRSTIEGEPHVHYYNRHFGFTLRPARDTSAEHDPYGPGLHHLCFRVLDETAIDRAARMLRDNQIDVSEPRYYAEYSKDYYAVFFSDPDGVRLEINNFWQRRRERMFDWDAEAQE